MGVTGVLRRNCKLINQYVSFVPLATGKIGLCKADCFYVMSCDFLQINLCLLFYVMYFHARQV